MNQLCFDDLLPKQQRRQPVKVLKLFELFAGYGSQSLALKRFNIPFESVGYCEIDKYAIQAYKALHGDHIKNYGDITKVNVDGLPNMNLLTYSFPCQDISVAGKQRGLSKDSGTRSSLLWECHRIIEAKRPEYLMMENVKNLVGKQNMPDFQAWLDTLTMLGYNNYWKVVNAKYCGVPQNRERVFCVSIRSDVDDGLFRFEDDFDNGIRLKDILETDVGEKYYISENALIRLTNRFEGHHSKIKNGEEIASCVMAGDYKLARGMNLIQVKEATKQGYAIAHEGDSINLEHPKSNTRRGRVGLGVAQTLTTSCNQAVVESCRIVGRNPHNPKSRMSGLPTEQMLEVSDSYDICNCLTTVQKDSLVKETYTCNTIGKIDIKGHDYIKRVYSPEGLSPTLSTMQGGNQEPKIYYKYRIRKLTPRECFRLMGLSDQEIEKIQSTDISNSQQYKMAGNSIVVDAMEFLKNINGGY